MIFSKSPAENIYTIVTGTMKTRIEIFILKQNFKMIPNVYQITQGYVSFETGE